MKLIEITDSAGAKAYINPLAISFVIPATQWKELTVEDSSGEPATMEVPATRFMLIGDDKTFIDMVPIESFMEKFREAV